MDSEHSNPRLSKVAIFALIYGVLAVPILGMTFAALAVIFGHVGLWKCKRSKTNPNPLRGRRAALIGLILGYISLFSTPFVVVGLSSAGFIKKDELIKLYQDRYLERRMMRSLDAASRLYLANETYASQNNDLYPTVWNDLVGRYLTKNDLTLLLKSSHPGGAEESFRLVQHERPVPLTELATTIVIQEVAPPTVEEIVIVYADGNSDFLPNPDFE